LLKKEINTADNNNYRKFDELKYFT